VTKKEEYYSSWIDEVEVGIRDPEHSFDVTNRVADAVLYFALSLAAITNVLILRF